jgi:hypothetical protein
MEPEQQIGLSLEQEFNLRSFDQQIENINLEQAKVLLSQLHKQLLLREAYFKHFIKQSLIKDNPWIE